MKITDDLLQEAQWQRVDSQKEYEEWKQEREMAQRKLQESQMCYNGMRSEPSQPKVRTFSMETKAQKQDRLLRCYSAADLMDLPSEKTIVTQVPVIEGFQIPLQTKQGQDQFISWTFTDMVGLAAKLPELTAGANKWILTLEEWPAGYKLALGDIKAL